MRRPRQTLTVSTLRITNGRVLRPDHTLEHADVLIDQPTGTIEAIGDPGGGTTVLDAGGGIVMPGLVNAHTHVAMTLMRGVVEDRPLEEWLNEAVWPIEAELEPHHVDAGAALGIAEMIMSGITTFSDMYFEIPELASVVDRAGIRAVLGHTAISDANDPDTAAAEMQRSIDVATEFNGAADGRITTTVQPHNPATVSHELLTEYVPEARARDLRLHYHANETADEVDRVVDERGARPLVYADEVGMVSEQDLIAHCVHVDDEEIATLADRGATAVHCPAANMKIASGIAPVVELLEAGVPVALGTDGPASNNDLDMFDEMCDAAMIAKIKTNDAAALPAEEVLRMATEYGADALGLNSGRLTVGSNADLIVVDTSTPKFSPGHSPVTELVYTANGGDVKHTIVDGQVLMAGRELQTLDREAVKTAANEAATDLLTKAGVA